MSSGISAGSLIQSPSLAPYVRAVSLIRTHAVVVSGRDKEVDDTPLSIGNVAILPITGGRGSQLVPEGERTEHMYWMLARTDAEIRDTDRVREDDALTEYVVVAVARFSAHYEVTMRQK